MRRKKEIDYQESDERYEIVHSPSELNDQNSEAFVPDETTGAVVVHHMVTIVLIIACFAIGTWAYLTFKSTSFFVPVEEGSKKSLQPYMIKAQSDRLHKAIDVYYKTNDKYPNSLEDIVAEKILKDTDPFYPPNSEFRYEKLANTYSLEVVITTVEDPTPPRVEK